MAQFDVRDINRGSAVVSVEKLNWFNRQHILRLAATPEGLRRLADIVLDHLAGAALDGPADAAATTAEHWTRPIPEAPGAAVDREYVLRVVAAIVTDRIALLGDVSSTYRYFFREASPEQVAAIRATLAPAVAATIRHAVLPELARLPDFADEKALSACLKARLPADDPRLPAGAGPLKQKDLLQGLRSLLTGSPAGAPIATVMAVLGKQVAERRLAEC
ncbi:hypothetical protein H696_00771 [Fonticula alba]|uniref:Aminoacyl-tRNA synthetase class I anticodon-binding domain-containing protein n=1 Tax=Fonticula alba TaxID=691883 RepID=A0A058ZFU4_FONAL|nr:hypothetical protein H696_00771 [Fonticula alba]KCV73229.1 hypothetical protein H696_00771 [Fonticula alba]|eukprot:XP_009492930.1 hypothetical protein H696_00771 [Fonticula alba]